MAGRGSRFAKEGYQLPKPLIPVHDKRMIEVVVDNITPNKDHRFIFICQKEHLHKYDLKALLNKIAPGCVILTVPDVTEGAACTVLVAEDYINNDDELMIANSDQYVDISIDDYLSKMVNSDGLIMTMTADDPKWSFIKYNDCGNVVMLREKEVISNEATVGIYNFAHGSDFVKAAKEMIRQNLRVNGEYYVAPAYNILIENGKIIKYHNIGAEDNGMYGLGIPSDLKKFLSNPLSFKYKNLKNN